MSNKVKGKTSKELVDILVRETVKYGQRQIALKFDISPTYLHDIINFRRGISKDFAKKMGFVPKLIWQKIEES